VKHGAWGCCYLYSSSFSLSWANGLRLPLRQILKRNRNLRLNDAIRPPIQIERAGLVIDRSTERVLVVPSALFHRAGVFQGFNPRADYYLPRILEPANLSYRLRSDV